MLANAVGLARMWLILQAQSACAGETMQTSEARAQIGYRLLATVGCLGSTLTIARADRYPSLRARNT